jgi:hypothetical protein
MRLAGLVVTLVCGLSTIASSQSVEGSYARISNAREYQLHRCTGLFQIRAPSAAAVRGTHPGLTAPNAFQRNAKVVHQAMRRSLHAMRTCQLHQIELIACCP